MNLSTVLGMTKPITEETWRPIGKVLSRLAARLTAQRNSGCAEIAAPSRKDGPPARGETSQRPDAATRGAPGEARRRNEMEIAASPLSGSVGSASEKPRRHEGALPFSISFAIAG